LLEQDMSARDGARASTEKFDRIDHLRDRLHFHQAICSIIAR